MTSALTKAGREATNRPELARELYELIVKQSELLGTDVPEGIEPPASSPARAARSPRHVRRAKTA